jgi:hypothetical protein
MEGLSSRRESSKVSTRVLLRRTLWRTSTRNRSGFLPIALSGANEPVWFCSECRHGPFTVRLNEYCPHCQHRKCSKCRVETNKSRRLHGPTGPSPDGGIQGGFSSTRTGQSNMLDQLVLMTEVDSTGERNVWDQFPLTHICPE